MSLWSIVSIRGTEGPLIEYSDTNLTTSMDLSSILLTHPTIPLQATDILQDTKDSHYYEQHTRAQQQETNEVTNSSQSEGQSPCLSLTQSLSSPSLSPQKIDHKETQSSYKNTPIHSVEPQCLFSQDSPITSSEDDGPPPLITKGNSLHINYNNLHINEEEELLLINEEALINEQEEPLLINEVCCTEDNLLSFNKKEENIVPGGEELVFNEEEELVLNNEEEEQLFNDSELLFNEREEYLLNVEELVCNDDKQSLGEEMIPIIEEKGREEELLLKGMVTNGDSLSSFDDDCNLYDTSAVNMEENSELSNGDYKIDVPIKVERDKHDRDDLINIVDRSTSITPVISYEYLSSHEVEGTEHSQELSSLHSTVIPPVLSSPVFIVNDKQGTIVTSQLMSLSRADESMIIPCSSKVQGLPNRRRSKKRLNIAAVFNKTQSTPLPELEKVQNSNKYSIMEEISPLTFTATTLNDSISIINTNEPPSVSNVQQKFISQPTIMTKVVADQQNTSIIQDTIPSQFESEQLNTINQNGEYELIGSKVADIYDEISFFEKQVQSLRDTLQEREDENELVQLDDEKSRLIDRLITANLHQLDVSFWSSHYKCQLERIADKLPAKFDYEQLLKLRNLKTVEQSLKLQTELFI